MRQISLATAILLFIAGPLGAQDGGVTGLVAEAQVVTRDLAHFDELLDELPRSADTVATIQKVYLDRATPGLRAYAANFGIDAEALAEAMAARPAFYASLRGLTARIEGVEPDIRRALAGWKELYPDVVCPPTYLFIGTQRAGGIARSTGLLISADVYSAPPEARASEGGRSVHPLANLPYLIAHELAHYQQFTVQGLDRYRELYRNETSLLGLAIREGSADFLADLASGGHINGRAHAYGRQHEQELWERFQPVMLESETGDWMFRRPENGIWPQDLGYFIGYVITESYYGRQANPREAVEEILAVTDFVDFLARSGYDVSR